MSQLFTSEIKSKEGLGLTAGPDSLAPPSACGSVTHDECGMRHPHRRCLAGLIVRHGEGDPDR